MTGPPTVIEVEDAADWPKVVDLLLELVPGNAVHLDTDDGTTLDVEYLWDGRVRAKIGTGDWFEPPSMKALVYVLNTGAAARPRA